MKWKFLFALILIVSFLPEYKAYAQSEGDFKEGIYIHQIAIHPKDTRILYAATDNQGVLKSTDGGKTWALINQGIKSYLLYHIEIHPKAYDTLYLTSWGGGVYKSTNAGAAWSERNMGLEDTAIWTLILLPPDRDTLYVATYSGVYKGKNGGEGWVSVSKGLSLGQEELPQCMIHLPSKTVTLFLGTNKGIYRWKEGESNWSKVSGTEPMNVTTLAYNPRTGHLYAGVLSKGIYKSPLTGQAWQPLGDIKTHWVDEIVFHPVHQATFYAMTRNRGILKTVDGGKSWSELNDGINDEWVTTLTFDPKDSEVIYAGTHEHGIFKSINGGKTWTVLLEFALQSPAGRNEALLPKVDSNNKISIPPAPQAFKKCNGCHGWTDPLLNFHPHTFFRMAANHRDWTGAVKRMSRRAQLLPGEETEILQHLNTYYGPNHE